MLIHKRLIFKQKNPLYPLKVKKGMKKLGHGFERGLYLQMYIIIILLALNDFNNFIFEDNIY